MAFDNIAFPLAIALGSAGGPEFSTEVTETAGGFEVRNQNWAGARLRFDVSSGVRRRDQWDTLLAFFYARAGRARAFRFRDWADWRSCAPGLLPAHTDQALGLGDGAKQFWQLTKTYSSGGVSYVRKITRPVAGTVRVGLAGVNQAAGWTVDANTGLITFTVPPAAGVAVSAGFDFDVPARFDVDALQAAWPVHDVAQLPEIPVVEVRE